MHFDIHYVRPEAHIEVYEAALGPTQDRIINSKLARIHRVFYHKGTNGVRIFTDIVALNKCTSLRGKRNGFLAQTKIGYICTLVN